MKLEAVYINGVSEGNKVNKKSMLKIPEIWIRSKSFFYNVVFSTYFRSNAAEKRVYHINCCLIKLGLDLKIKSSFLRIIKQLMTLQWFLDLFS